MLGMAVDPRVSPMLGRGASGFHQPGRHCLHRAQSAVRQTASRMKGELHPATNRLRGGLWDLVLTFLHMNDSVNNNNNNNTPPPPLPPFPFPRPFPLTSFSKRLFFMTSTNSNRTTKKHSPVKANKA